MIIDREELEVWMISLLDRVDVKPVRQQALDTWYEQGVDINFFDAVTPDEITSLPIKLNLTRKEKMTYYGGPVDFSPTEKAIWYSHVLMWKYCIEVNRSICVIEEDCQLIREWPQFFMVYKLAGFCYDSKDITPAAGYIITPNTAKYLYNLALSEPLTYNVDHLLRKNLDDVEARDLAIQVPRNWRTIDHW